MTRAVVPLGDLVPRLPEHGRIRLGVKKISNGGKEYPSKIPQFRFTSHDKTALEQLAKLHGGEVRPWAGSPREGEYELLSRARTLRIVLPPDPLGGTPIYEKWSGGGCERRCDGVTCPRPVDTPDGAEMADGPCICAERGLLECKPTTRLNVVLRDVQFAGTWRLETHSWTAAHELPGMAAMIQQLQHGGLTAGLLTLKEYRAVKAGKTHKWQAPCLAVEYTIDEIVSGAAQLGALASGEQVARLAIDAPTVEQPAMAIEAEVRDARVPDDDEVVTAELVDDMSDACPDDGDDDTKRAEWAAQDPKGGGEVEPGTDSVRVDVGAAGSAESSVERARKKLHALVRDCTNTGANGKARGAAAGVDPDTLRHAIIRTVTGMDQSSNSLAPDELSRVLDLTDDIVAGRRKFRGIDENGLVRVGEKHDG